MTPKHDVTSPDVYRARAAECMQMAQTARRVDRELFLRMAQQWLALADQAAAENVLMADDDADSGPKASP